MVHVFSSKTILGPLLHSFMVFWAHLRFFNKNTKLFPRAPHNTKIFPRAQHTYQNLSALSAQYRYCFRVISTTPIWLPRFQHNTKMFPRYMSCVVYSQTIARRIRARHSPRDLYGCDIVRATYRAVYVVLRMVA